MGYHAVTPVYPPQPPSLDASLNARPSYPRGRESRRPSSQFYPKVSEVWTAVELTSRLVPLISFTPLCLFRF